jgi:hypothetical protein
MNIDKPNEYAILLIMNCQKYVKKALYQKMTWLKLISPLKYYHVIGRNDLSEDFVFDNENHILWINVADDYISLPKKVIKAYEAVNKTFQYQYIFKTDDDQILVNKSFFSILTNILTTKVPTIHYGGYIVNVKENYLSQYNKIHPELPDNLILLKTTYCSGRFYFLSKDAVLNLLTKKYKIFNECLEDYAIGYNLDDKYKTNTLMLQTNKFFTDIELSDFPRVISENKI